MYKHSGQKKNIQILWPDHILVTCFSFNCRCKLLTPQTEQKEQKDGQNQW